MYLGRCFGHEEVCADRLRLPLALGNLHDLASPWPVTEGCNPDRRKMLFCKHQRRSRHTHTHTHIYIYIYIYIYMYIYIHIHAYSLQYCTVSTQHNIHTCTQTQCIRTNIHTCIGLPILLYYQYVQTILHNYLCYMHCSNSSLRKQTHTHAHTECVRA